VAIRTAVIDEAAGALEYGVGSGIVWDSNPEHEYEECLLKASILGRRPRPFELLETLRWTPEEGFLLLDRHLARIASSAAYFGFACSTDGMAEALSAAVQAAARAMRVRLLVSEDGAVRVESSPLAPAPDVMRVGIAAAPIDPADVFLFHKTTSRAQYERARLEAVGGAGLDDVVLWNPMGDVTESTIANIVVEVEGQRVTPPVTCGLLAGTFREELMATRQVIEGPVSLSQLRSAPRFWLVNSVRGWCRAVLATESPASGT